LPELIQATLLKEEELRYGENPHQKAAIYSVLNSDKKAHLKQLHGKELSYNNYLDIEAAISIVGDLKLPAAAVIKHSNPCGAAIAEDALSAYKKAYEADPISAFGSIVGFNRNINLKTAEELSKTFIEVIVAPKYDDDALALLRKKSALRLLEVGDMNTLKSELMYRYIGNKFLVQQPDTYLVTEDDLSFITTKAPKKNQINDLLFANTLVKHVKSNAIVIVKDGQSIGVGAGQMSRVDSVEIALKKAGEKAKGAVLASDAFFPFSDSVELAAKYGISAIIQPGGSKRDQESIDACNEHGISMCFTGIRHFKH
jgi:phosphoribosylaminoimidazolecarboxamide formyltransferase/IMP cyclohydrolase